MLLRFTIIACLFFEVAISAIDLVVSAYSRSNRDTSGEKIQSELEYPVLDIFQITLAICTIYLLTVYQKIQEKVAKRDDPFSNASMLALLIFILIIQKYMVESLLAYMLQNELYFNQKVLITFR